MSTTPVGKKRKSGMDTEVFDIISWNDVEAALKGTSKMFKMWHAKQGSGFYRGQARGKETGTPDAQAAES